MRGSIVQKPKRTGRWYVLLELEPDDTGRRRQKWHSGFATRAEAEKGLTALLAARDAGTYVPPQRLTVRMYLLDHWLPAIESTVRPSTMNGYRQHVEHYLVPRIGRHRLQGLMPDEITKVYRTLEVSGGRGGRPLSGTTVRRIHATLHRALSDAVGWGYLLRNPASVAMKPKQRRPGSYDRTAWTAEELSWFLQSVRSDRLFALWQLAAMTGMRRGELLGLRWQDVQVAQRRLSVRQTLISYGYQLSFGEPKTARGRRNLALDAVTAAALGEWRRAQLAERIMIGPGWPDTDLVFTREDGSPIHPDTLSFWFNRHVRLAGQRRIRLHDLRHTYASLAMQAGVPAKIVSERLGHATVAFTLDVYSHTIPSMDEAAAEQVAALLNPARHW